MEPFESQTEYRVAYADTDQMGVVYYANFLVLFERARSHLLRDLGHPYGELEKQGYRLPITEAHVDYVQPAHYEDLLVLSASAEFVSPVRVKLHCRVHRDGELLAHGYTMHAWYSAEKGRPVRAPESLVEVVSGGI